jgi:catechol 2,3-dioxygenase-like lactoylglutathione lyase family enzyme
MLHHVSIELPAAEAERTLEFWRLVGFERVEAPGAIAPFVTWVEREGTQIHLILTDQATVPTLGHAAVAVDDFDATVARLREHDFEVEDADELWGAPRAFAIAPGGHRVELMASPPPSADD